MNIENNKKEAKKLITQSFLKHIEWQVNRPAEGGLRPFKAWEGSEPFVYTVEDFDFAWRLIK
ncbi:hypothetical protein AB4379_12230 [Vibrio breoganii]